MNMQKLFVNYPQREKICKKLEKKFKNFSIKLKMAIAPSIFKKFFANTHIFIVE